MANNKVQLADGTVLIDITDTTAVASDVAAGKYFYTAAGVKTLGTGSGGGGGDDIADLASKSVESYENNTFTDPLYIFRANTGLKSLMLSAVTTLKADAINGCTNLETLKLPSLTTISGANAIRGTKITALSLPNLTSANQRYAISYNTSLIALDLAVLSSLLGDFGIEGNSALTALVLRRTESVVTLGSINRFNSTPFASGGSGGTLYVPQSLISSYQSATNWSTILGYANNQIKSIESTHTDPNAPIDLTLYYADGTPIPTE